MAYDSAQTARSDDEQRRQARRIRSIASFCFMAALLVILTFVAANTGTLKVSADEMIRGLFFEYDQNVSTIYDLRFPRIAISLLAGAAVAVSGALFQAVLKNPLADPGIIGISSGASFASVLVVGLAPMLYFYTPLFACLGGVVAFALVYGLSWKGGLSPLRIILVGVAVNALFTGLSSAFGASGFGSSGSVASIVSGNITMKTWSDVETLAPYTVVGLVLSLACTRTCNMLMLEDKTARGLGVDVNRSRILVSMVAVLLASIATAVAGPISFLGLIVPHIGRILVGSDHKALIPFCMLFGACMFLFADTLGRTIVAPNEISAAIIMSVIGGPFFIILLRGSKKYAA